MFMSRGITIVGITGIITGIGNGRDGRMYHEIRESHERREREWAERQRHEVRDGDRDHRDRDHR